MSAATQLKPPKVYGDPNVYSFIQNNIGAFINIPGDVFWVDLINGKAGQDGSWQQPTNLIQTAHGFSTSGNGDAIFVKGFSKAGTDAAENLIWSKRDVSLIAAVPLGNACKLTIAPTSGIAIDLAAGAQGGFFYGVRFQGVSAVGARIGVDGPRFVECDFNSDTTHGVSFVPTGATLGTGSGALFEACEMAGCGGSGIMQNKGGAGAMLGLQATNVIIRNSRFYNNTNGDISDDAADANATYFYQWLIENSEFMDTSKTTFLDMKGGKAQNLMVRSCSFGQTLNNVKIKIPAAGAAWVNNYDPTGLVTQAAIT